MDWSRRSLGASGVRSDLQSAWLWIPKPRPILLELLCRYLGYPSLADICCGCTTAITELTCHLWLLLHLLGITSNRARITFNTILDEVSDIHALVSPKLRLWIRNHYCIPILGTMIHSRVANTVSSSDRGATTIHIPVARVVSRMDRSASVGIIAIATPIHAISVVQVPPLVSHY